jgi:hypothetical protein
MKIAIINRSFWPVYPVIGEALMRFAESAAKDGHTVSVIMQDHVDIKKKLEELNRGEGIKFYPVKAFTTSSSKLFLRIVDAIFFMFWVFIWLVWVNPKKVYISTDPPVLVPFIVMLYCKLSQSKYIYHLQDIHPEATNVIFPLNKKIYKILQKIDNTTLRNAESLITINEHMASYLKTRSLSKASIYKLDNPAISFEGLDFSQNKKEGFSFCGNAGRLQRMPLLLGAIETYLSKGGILEFSFAGGGVYEREIEKLASKFNNFHYYGVVTADEAAQINYNFTWALLPIEDEVTKYAFPSKSSSYVMSGANILAICNKETSVGTWVNKFDVGLVIEPNESKLVKSFFDIEKNLYQDKFKSELRNELKKKLNFSRFLNKLREVILN